MLGFGRAQSWIWKIISALNPTSAVSMWTCAVHVGAGSEPALTEPAPTQDWPPYLHFNAGCIF